MLGADQGRLTWILPYWGQVLNALGQDPGMVQYAPASAWSVQFVGEADEAVP
jgi:hypothetical protein